MSAPLLSVGNLSTSFFTSRGEVQAVRGVSFELRAGEILGIVGESGSGKSMTALAIPALLPPTAKVVGGHVRFQGKDLARLSEQRLSEIRGLEIGMIFQNPMTSLNPLMRIGKQVAEPLLLHGKADRRTARARVTEIFRKVSIPDPETRARAYPNEFSGGMLQRAMIATALVNAPQLVIADEPTTALDVTVQAQVLDLLGRLQELHAAGFKIALDDFVYSKEADDILSLASIVKIDVMAGGHNHAKEQAELLRPFGVQLLAEKVEDRGMFAYCLGLGYELFQGYFFCKPEIVTGREIPTSMSSSPAHLSSS